MLEITVRSTHIDIMGHVNNAKYVEFLEWGRCDELDKLGIDIWDMVKQKLGFAVVNLNINYRREAFVGDLLEIETTFQEIRNRKIGVSDQIITKRGSDEIVCEAEVSFLIFNLDTHKSISMPQEFLHIFTPAPS